MISSKKLESLRMNKLILESEWSFLSLVSVGTSLGHGDIVRGVLSLRTWPLVISILWLEWVEVLKKLFRYIQTTKYDAASWNRCLNLHHRCPSLSPGWQSWGKDTFFLGPRSRCPASSWVPRDLSRSLKG